MRKLLTAMIWAAILFSAAQTVTAAHSAPFAAPWIDGTKSSEAEMQVQQHDPDTFVIRQSVKTSVEAPFIFLFFGNDRALLLDTGAGGLKIRPTVDKIIADWLAKKGRAS